MPVNTAPKSGDVPSRSRRDALVQWVIALGRRLHRGASSPHPAVLVGVSVALLVAVVVSWKALGLSLQAIDWRLLAFSALLVPVSVGITAAEYRLLGRSNQIEVSWRHATTITVLGTVANLLPIPGAAAVRVNDLVAKDATAARATRATIAIGVLWLGWSLVLSGIGLMSTDSLLVGGLLVVGGITTVLITWFLAPPRTLQGFGARQWFTIGSIIEISTLLVGSLRIWLTLAALGTSATFLQAIGLVAAGAIASSVGLLPGGLGIRELIAGLLAPLVGLSVASAILTITIVRLVSLAVQVPIALLAARSADNDGT